MNPSLETLMDIEGSPHLSPREQQVLNLILEGLSDKEIADQLHIASSTVHQYVHALLFKVQVRNRTELAIWAARQRTRIFTPKRKHQ
jgi:DNA-binding NarL/FixJ family response regulator